MQNGLDQPDRRCSLSTAVPRKPQSPTPWYVDAFDELYPLLYPHRDDASADREIGALLDWLDPAAGEDVLDVCCGTGRHMAAIGRKGFAVTGLDLSEAQLSRADGRPECRGRVVRADMRAIPFGPVFGLVVNLFSSFGYFDDDRNNETAMAQMAGAVRPGGRLVMDHINARHLERSITEESRSTVGGATAVHHRAIVDRRVVKRSVITFADGSTREVTESVRLYEPDELATMVRRAGLDSPATFGSFDGAPLNDESDRMIVVARRP